MDNWEWGIGELDVSFYIVSGGIGMIGEDTAVPFPYPINCRDSKNTIATYALRQRNRVFYRICESQPSIFVKNPVSEPPCTSPSKMSGVGLLFVAFFAEALPLKNEILSSLLEGIPKLLSGIDVALYFWFLCQGLIVRSIKFYNNKSKAE